MKVRVLLFAIAGCLVLRANEVETNFCVIAKDLLETMASECRATFAMPIRIQEDWSNTGLATNAHFCALRRLMEGDWIRIFPMVLNLSTNKVERMVVLSAGIATNETDYLLRMDVLSGLVLSNRVSTLELHYFDCQCSDANKFGGSAMLRRYDEVAVSNLIMKVYSAGGFPGGVEDVFTGEAKRSYEEAVQDGAL